MALTITFALSGTAIVALVAVKRAGQRKGRDFILLRLISRGDTTVRELGHTCAYIYAQGKERLAFLVQKQIPLRVKGTWNKYSALATEASEQYLEKIRDIKLLNGRSEGISEFFKSVKEVERGNGSIEEPWDDSFQEAEEGVK